VTAATSNNRFTGDLRADVLVAIVILAALIGGYVYRQSLYTATTRVTDSFSGFSISIPSQWSVNQANVDDDTFISASNPQAASLYKSSVSGKSFAIDTESPATIDDIVDRLIQQHGDELLGFHLLDDQPTTIDGVSSRAVRYAYVTRPIDDPFSDAPPVVVIATDYIIYTSSEYWIITVTVDEKIADDEQTDFEHIIGSITLPQ
jgi:hypothetical protein